MKLKAPKAIEAYSQGVIAGGFVFCSGRVAFDPSSRELSAGPIEEQTRLVLKNVGAVLESAASSLVRVVKTTIFLQGINDFTKVNQIYGEFFEPPFPAKATVQVAGLPRDAKVEIKGIVLVK
jgi:2-iminobutanoate/2-iminopropanoate deaminase